MTLAYEERPSDFSSIVGQEEPIEILESIAETPERCPRSLIFRGPFGVGKTTASRVFARALNCQSDEKLICGECRACTQDVLSSSYYLEFDSTDLGVSNVRDMKKQFSSQVTTCRNRIVCFDEAHTATRKTQSSLLKVLEEDQNNLSFVFCTTDFDGLLDTVVSRSLVLDFKLVSKEEMRKLLNGIIDKRGIEISEKSLNYVVESARGHPRDAVLSLGLCDKLGDGETFRNEVETSEKSILKCLAALEADEEKFKERVDGLKSFVLSDLRAEMESSILKLIRSRVGVEVDSMYSEYYDKLSEEFGSRVYKIMKLFSTDWFVNSFDSNASFESAMWAMKQVVSTNSRVSTNGESSESSHQKFAKA